MTEWQGHVTVEGEFATLEFERRLPYPPETVWEAITDPEQLSDWYMTKAQIDGRIGGHVEFWSTPSQIHVTGSILAWDPPHLFEHEWHVEARPEFPNGERATIRWEIFPQEGDTSVLRLTHRHLTRRTARVFAPGAHAFLEMLEAYLAKRPMPDWTSRVKELRHSYAPGVRPEK